MRQVMIDKLHLSPDIIIHLATPTGISGNEGRITLHHLSILLA